MKSFDEWFERQDIDNWTNKKFMLKAFEAGQQSKQVEVDGLQARVDEAMRLLQTRQHNADVTNIIFEMHKILKGDQS